MIMKNWKKIMGCLAGAALALNMNAQQVQGFVHEQSKATDYVWPTDPQVLEKLDKWQDLKFGYCSTGDCIQYRVSWNHGQSVRKTWIGSAVRKIFRT